MADSNPSMFDWVTESDYGKVIFKDVKKLYSPSSEIVCSFEIRDEIKPSPEDYVGLFAVGFRDLSQCIISKKVKPEKKQAVTFSAEELPQKKTDFYQFLYVGEKGTIHGASIPFLLQDSDEDIITDEDFLIINPPPSEEVVDDKTVATAEIESLPKVSPETSLDKATQSMTPVNASCDKLRIRILTADKEKLTAQLEDVVSLNNSAEEMKKQLIANNEKLQTELQNLKDCMVGHTDTKAMLLALEDSKKICISEMKRLKDHNQELENTLRATEDKHMKLQNRYAELESQLSELLSELNFLRSSNTMLNSQVKDYEAKNQMLEARIREQETKTTALKNDAVAAQATIKKMEDELSLLNEESHKTNSVLEKQVSELKEKESAQCKEIADMKFRLTEAAELYKEQYVEIAQLKKSVKKLQDIAADSQKPNQSASGVGPISSGGTAAENSDGDTGERKHGSRVVTPLPLERERARVSPYNSEISYDRKRSYSTKKEATTCSYKQKESECVETIACYICQKKFPVAGNNKFLIDHLDTEHSQKVCPICGMTFEGKLPPQYMTCHINAHFSS